MDSTPAGLVSPLATSRRKYSGTGWYTPETFCRLGVHPSIAQTLAKKANHGLSMSSWKSYASAISNINKCNKEMNCSLNLPFTIQDSLTFIGWMLQRGLQANTASKYLSGVRMWHLAQGFDEPLLRNPITKQVLRGATNFNNLNRLKGKKRRLPMTIIAMKLLKKFLD